MWLKVRWPKFAAGQSLIPYANTSTIFFLSKTKILPPNLNLLSKSPRSATDDLKVVWLPLEVSVIPGHSGGHEDKASMPAGREYNYRDVQ